MHPPKVPQKPSLYIITHWSLCFIMHGPGMQTSVQRFFNYVTVVETLIKRNIQEVYRAWLHSDFHYIFCMSSFFLPIGLFI